MKNLAAITKRIMDTLPRHTPFPYEMAANTLRWELPKGQMEGAMSKIEKALRENEDIKDFTLQHGQVRANMCFIQAVCNPSET